MLLVSRIRKPTSALQPVLGRQKFLWKNPISSYCCWGKETLSFWLVSPPVRYFSLDAAFYQTQLDDKKRRDIPKNQTGSFRRNDYSQDKSLGRPRSAMRPRDVPRRYPSPSTSKSSRERRRDLDDQSLEEGYNGQKSNAQRFSGKAPRHDRSSSPRWSDLDDPEDNRPRRYGNSNNTSARGREAHQRFPKGRLASRDGPASTIRSEFGRGLGKKYQARRDDDFRSPNRGRSQSMQSSRDSEDGFRSPNHRRSQSTGRNRDSEESHARRDNDFRSPNRGRSQSTMQSGMEYEESHKRRDNGNGFRSPSHGRSQSTGRNRDFKESHVRRDNDLRSTNRGRTMGRNRHSEEGIDTDYNGRRSNGYNRTNGRRVPSGNRGNDSFDEYPEQERVRVNHEASPTDQKPTRMFRNDWIKLKETVSRTIDREEATRTKYSPRVAKGVHKSHYLSSERLERRQRHDDEMEEDSQRQPGWNGTQKIYKEALAASFPPNNMKIFVSCLPGVEPILADEMHRLGFDCKMEGGGVTPTAPVTLEDIMRLNLHLGSASHVLLRCGEPFIARGLPELKRKVGQLPWHTLLSGRGQIQLQVRVNSKKSKLNHKTAIRTAVLEGINESLDKYEPGTAITVAHAKEGSETALPLSVRIENDEALLSLDTSPTPLHRRGYRFETAKAPLREDLAFAMLWSAGWCIRNNDNPQSSLAHFSGFLDPFCGSGTIAIEAASLAAGLPPGRLRSVPLAGTVLYQPKMWRNILEKAKRQANKMEAQRKRLKIAASDRDEGAVAAARSNAERAGVQGWIQFNCSAVGSHAWLNIDKTTSSEDAGPYPLLVATNPPFGLRIAADKKANSKVHPLLPLYQTLIGRQNRLSAEGHSISTMTLLQDPKLFRKTGAQFDVRFSSQHGGIPVAAVFTPPPTNEE